MIRMMDKELSEEIKRKIEAWNELPVMGCGHCGMEFRGEHECDYDYLKKQNKRYREALDFYARKHNYAYSALDDNIPKVNIDGGQRARRALQDMKIDKQ